MPIQPPRIPVRVLKWMENWLLTRKLPLEINWEVLAGDGSPRVFYRALAEGGPYVLLDDADWILSKDYAPHQAYLEKMGVPVPRFFEADPKAGVLLMEDLGNELLQMRIQSAAAFKSGWMDRAMEFLADLHGKTFPVPSSLPIASRRFDAAKYTEELFFTETHLNDGLLGLAPANDARRKAIQKFASSLESIQPDAFSHRDYHSRNLLVHQNKLVAIDFQDARLGPVHYDVASFVFDPYLPTSPEERERLIGRYKDRLKSHPLFQKLDWENFGKDVNRVGLQRVVKAAGSYASFFTRYKKPTHLKYLLPALSTAQVLAAAVGEEATFPLAEWRESVQKRKLHETT